MTKIEAIGKMEKSHISKKKQTAMKIKMINYYNEWK